MRNIELCPQRLVLTIWVSIAAHLDLNSEYSSFVQHSIFLFIIAALRTPEFKPLCFVTQHATEIL